MTVKNAPMTFSHKKLISVEKNITNIKNCDKHADQKTELDFTFFRKKATKNIPNIVP